MGFGYDIHIYVYVDILIDAVLTQEITEGAPLWALFVMSGLPAAGA